MDREDYDYGQWKQRQIDEGVWRKSKIGTALLASEKVQKYGKDPAPKLPFFEEEPPKTDWNALLVSAGIVVFVLLAAKALADLAAVL